MRLLRTPRVIGISSHMRSPRRTKMPQRPVIHRCNSFIQTYIFLNLNKKLWVSREGTAEHVFCVGREVYINNRRKQDEGENHAQCHQGRCRWLDRPLPDAPRPGGAGPGGASGGEGKRN